MVSMRAIVRFLLLSHVEGLEWRGAPMDTPDLIRPLLWESSWKKVFKRVFGMKRIPMSAVSRVGIKYASLSDVDWVLTNDGTVTLTFERAKVRISPKGEIHFLRVQAEHLNVFLPYIKAIEEADEYQ